jgi:hypothetical protein
MLPSLSLLRSLTEEQFIQTTENFQQTYRLILQTCTTKSENNVTDSNLKEGVANKI